MILLSTGTLNTYGLPRIFALAAEAGYDGIEIIIDARWDTRDAAYLRRMSSEYGLPVAVLHSPFLPGVEGWPLDQLGRLQRTLALAEELSVRLVVTHLPYRLYPMSAHWGSPKPRGITLPIPRVWREPYYHVLSDGRLADMENETGVTIAVENMPARRFLGITFDLYWFNRTEQMARFPHVTLDTTHVGTWGNDPVAVYGQLKGRLSHVHLSNYDGREHRPPSDGKLPLAALLRELARDEYEGAVTVESDPMAFHAEDEAQCLAELRRALAFCRENLAGR